MTEFKNTHMYLHNQGLLILNNDFKNIGQYLRKDTLITPNDVNVMEKHLHELNGYKDVFIGNAKVPDKRENKCYFENYEFIENWGMRVTKTKLLLPFFVFSQHFHSPDEARNYINKFDFITDKLSNSKIKWLRNLSVNIKKQGLTFNALTLFLNHACQAVITCKENNYTINKEVVKELSYAAHYLEDMNESHHATNKIGIGIFSFILWLKPLREYKFKSISNHSEFEKHASKQKSQFAINSIKDISKINSLMKGEKEFWEKYTYDNFLNYELLHNREGLKCFRQVCDWFGIYGNSFASGTINFDTGDKGDRVNWALSLNKNDWDKNLEQTIPVAQLSVAVFLFTFITYISNPSIFNFKY